MTEPVKHEERAHSRLGASGAYRWMACPGSLRLTAELEDVTTEYAAEGTAAHELGEMCLRSGADAADHLGLSITVGNRAYTVDEEMAEAVQVYLDTIRADFELPDLLFIEERFSLAHLYPGMFGTNDCGLYKVSGRKLIVYDYKHGKGVRVEVERNPQLIYYALGLLSTPQVKLLPVDEVELVIVQPRAGGEGVRRWTTDVLELLSFQGALVEAAKATEAPDAPLAAGGWCKFCQASGTCPELAADAMRSAQDEFADSPADLDSFTLAAILERADLIKHWIKSVQAEAFRRMRDGERLPGWKFVLGKPGNRKWIDGEEAAAHVRLIHGLSADDVYEPRKVRSPAQLEKLLPKADRASLAQFVTRSDPRPTLAPESDKRPEVPGHMAAEDDFND